MSELMTDRDISQGAPVVVQRATGRERIETYGNSGPIIHSVFHNSVENQGAQNASNGTLLSRTQTDLHRQIELTIIGDFFVVISLIAQSVCWIVVRKYGLGDRYAHLR